MADDKTQETAEISGNSAENTAFVAPGFEVLQNMWRMMSVAPAAGGLGSFGTGVFPGLAAAGGSDFPSVSANVAGVLSPASSQELDRRIAELRGVEHWLKLNLGMLQSTIQGLEVQQATLATLKAFGELAQTSFASAGAQMASAANLGSKAQARGAAEAAKAGSATTRATGMSGRVEASSTESAPKGAPGPDVAAGAAAKAGEIASEATVAWWRALNHQFNQLAAFAAAPAGPAATPAQASNTAKTAENMMRSRTTSDAAGRRPESAAAARGKSTATKREG